MLWDSVKKEEQQLFAGYFALVMATGITSIATHLLHFDTISTALFYLNNVEYAVLLLLYTFRLIFSFPAVKEDMKSSEKGSGFFTIVAGSCVLGLQYVLIHQNKIMGSILWIWALILWLLLLYTYLCIAIIKQDKAPIEKGINGSWLLIVVATQSVAILGTQVKDYLSLPADAILLFTVSCFSIGILFYIVLIVLVFDWLFFYKLQPQDFQPSYWIMMGAAAISTLSSCTLLQNINATSVFNEMIPFLKGLGLLTWAFGSFLIPLLLILDIWLYGSKKATLTYAPQHWTTVFTLGMYTVCTVKLSGVFNLYFLQVLPKLFIYIVLLVWVVAFFAMCIAIVRTLTTKKETLNVSN